MISVSLQTLALDLRLQICQQLYDPVHWIRPRTGPDTRNRRFQERERERVSSLSRLTLAITEDRTPVRWSDRHRNAATRRAPEEPVGKRASDGRAGSLSDLQMLTLNRFGSDWTLEGQSRGAFPPHP